MVSIDYVNGILFDLEKAFWDERGKGTRHRTNAVGRTYFKDRFFQSLKSAPLLDMAEIVEQPLKGDGIIRRMSAETDGRMLFLSVEGCAHRPVEERMASYGIHPFTCVVANQMIQAVEQVLDRPIELVGVKLEVGLCAVQLVLFDKRPFLE
jgi:hypothetical protein